MSTRNIIIAAQRAAGPEKQHKYYSYLNKYNNAFLYKYQAGVNFGLARRSKYEDLVYKSSQETLNQQEEDINLNMKTNWRFLKWIGMMYGFMYCFSYYYMELMYNTDNKSHEQVGLQKEKVRKQIPPRYSDVYAYREDDPHAVYVSLAAQVAKDKYELQKLISRAQSKYPEAWAEEEEEKKPAFRWRDLDEEDEDEDEEEGDEEEEEDDE